MREGLNRVFRGVSASSISPTKERSRELDAVLDLDDFGARGARGHRGAQPVEPLGGGVELGGEPLSAAHEAPLEGGEREDEARELPPRLDRLDVARTGDDLIL